MELYAQFGISNWEFKTNNEDTYLLNYISKESVEYNAKGTSSISLYMQIVSNELKQFIVNSNEKDITLYRHRLVRILNGDDVPLEEYFINVKIKSFVEDITNGRCGEIIIMAESGK